MDNIISKQKVCEAAEQLYRELGTFPTVRAITALLLAIHGSGGTTALVTRWLKEWRQAKDNLNSSDVSSLLTVPIELAQAQEGATRALWSIATRVANHQLADRVSECQQKEFDNEQGKLEAIELADDYQRELAACRAKLAGCEESLVQAHAEIAKGTTPIREIENENLKLQVSYKVVSAQLAATDNRMEIISNDYEAAKLALEERRTKFERELRLSVSECDALQAGNNVQTKIISDLNLDASKMRSEIADLIWKLQQTRVEREVDSELIANYKIEAASTQSELRSLREFQSSAMEIFRAAALRPNAAIPQMTFGEQRELPAGASLRDDLIPRTALSEHRELPPQ